MAFGAFLWAIALIGALVSFSNGPVSGFAALLGAIIVGGISFLLYVIQIRLVLEFFAANIRTAQNTSELVAKAEGDDKE